MEQFRAPIVDSLVVTLLNKSIFKLEDFTEPDERGGVYLTPKALKVFLNHWQKRLHTQITHPLTKTKMTYYRCLELQVGEYIDALMKENHTYRPMFAKM